MDIIAPADEVFDVLFFGRPIQEEGHHGIIPQAKMLWGESDMRDAGDFSQLDLGTQEVIAVACDPVYIKVSMFPLCVPIRTYPCNTGSHS